MSFKAKSLGAEWTVRSGKTVLEEALAQAVPFPHSCKAGRCGACRSRLLQGKIEHLSSSRYVLSEEEKEAGVFLACRALAQSDLELQWLSAEEAPAIRESETVIESLEPLPPTVYALRLRVREPLAFLAGQFAELSFPGCGPRHYSMASLPGAETLDFYIRTFPEGEVSEYLRSRARLGDRVRLKGPLGDSYLRKEETGPILAVAGSTGIAPILSILQEARRSGMQQKIFLYFGVRKKEDFFALEKLVKLQAESPQLRVRLAVAEDPGSHRFAHGPVGEVVLQDWPEFPGSAYLAGSPAMVEPLAQELKRRGVERIYSDPFVPASGGESVR